MQDRKWWSNRRKKNGAGKKKKNRRNKKKNNKNKQPKAAVENAEALVNELSRQGKAAIGPSLNFLTQTGSKSSSSTQPLLPQPSQPIIRQPNSPSFDFRTGRQTANTPSDKVVVPGFPNGLPNGVPEGVKIALASANRGKYLTFIM